MDWGQIISELGGGLPGVVIAALAFVAWKQRQEITSLYLSAIDRERTHAQELSQTVTAVDQAVRVLEAQIK